MERHLLVPWAMDEVAGTKFGDAHLDARFAVLLSALVAPFLSRVKVFGHPPPFNSVPNLTRRFEARPKSQPQLLNDAEEILRRATALVADSRRTTLDTPSAGSGSRKQKTKSDIAPRSSGKENHLKM